jgi:hypothetical protein
MCVWRMAVCVCRMYLHDRVCGMCGVCCCVWHGVCVAGRVGWRVTGRCGLVTGQRVICVCVQHLVAGRS